MTTTEQSEPRRISRYIAIGRWNSEEEKLSHWSAGEYATEAEELEAWKRWEARQDHPGMMYEIVPKWEFTRWNEYHNGYFEQAIEYVPGTNTKVVSGIQMNLHKMREMVHIHLIEARDAKLLEIKDAIIEAINSETGLSADGSTQKELEDLKADVEEIPTQRMLYNIYYHSSSAFDLMGGWPTHLLGERNFRERPRLETPRPTWEIDHSNTPSVDWENQQPPS